MKTFVRTQMHELKMNLGSTCER